MTAPSGGGLSPEELVLALEAARAGTFRLDLRTNAVRWSPSLAALHGIDADQAPETFEAFLELVHPDDREPLATAIRRTVEAGVPYTIRLRALHPDGTVLWTEAAGRRVDDAGGPAALVGVARDIDREQRAHLDGEEMGSLLDAIYSTAPVGLAFVDRDLRYVRINEAMAALAGLSVDEHLGRTVGEVLPAPLAAAVEPRLREVRDTGRVVREEDVGAGEERRLSASYYPVRGAGGAIAGVGVVVSDTTAHLQAARARERVLERTRFLADVSAALDASLDYDATLRTVADLAVRRIADWCSIDMVEDGGLRNVAVAHVDPEKVALARDLQRRYPPDLDAPTGAAHVALRTGEPELYPEITPELMERAGADDEQVAIMRSLGLRSAMVVPLRARERVLGALTLIATHDRPAYDADDLAFAQEVAARAGLAVDNARLYREAREQERRSEEARALLDTLIDQAPIGVAFLDREGRFVRVNEALAEMHRIPVADHLGRLVGDVLPDLAATASANIEHVLAHGAPLADAEVARTRPDGEVSHYLVSYYPVRLAGGDALGVGITVLDMSARVRVREELSGQLDLYQALLRAQSELGEAFALLDGERIVFVNAATERIAGRTAAELYRLPSVFALVPPELQRVVGARIRDARAGAEPGEPGFATEILRPDGTRVPIEAAGRPLPGEGGERLVIIARDITERRHQEAERERLLRTEQAARRASEAAHARVRLLADASGLLERSLSREESLPDVAELLVARLSDAAMIDVLGRDGRIRRLAAATRSPGGERLLGRLAEGDRLKALSGHPIARVMREQQATFLDDPADRYMRDVARTEEELARFREAAGRSLAVVPLVARGRSVGAVTVGWRQAGRRPTREEWSLIEALAQRIALAVDSALQYEERAYVARTLQQSLLPGALPAIPGADVGAEYVAAGEGMEVGGDFYDLFALGGAGEWALVIGDVCGKGAEAAAVTALARYTVRALAARSPSPAATLATLNAEILRQMDDPRFLTAVVARVALDRAGGARVTLASGGHLPPVVLRAAGEAEVVRCSGMLLGVEPDAEADDCSLALGPGDALVLYTDGITEARADRPLDPQALADRLRPVLAEGAGAVARRAVAVAEEQARGALRDDVAVLVLRLAPRAV